MVMSGQNPSRLSESKAALNISEIDSFLPRPLYGDVQAKPLSQPSLG